MPAVLSEHLNLKKHNKPISETTTRKQTQSNINKTSKISSLFLSSSTQSNNESKPKISNSQTKKKNSNFASTTLRISLGGCTSAAAAEKVAVPEAVVTRNSGKSKRKTKKKVKSNDFEVQDESFNIMVDGNSLPDDERLKISQRERPCSVRRTVNPETISFLESNTDFVSTYTEQEVFGTKYYRQPRHPSPEDYAEITMLQRGLIRGNRLDMPDRYRAWRLDVDNMSYEELLELGDRIGYVNTGLKEDEISCCLRKFKLSTLCALSHNLPMQFDRKCSICQEEYEAGDEIGKLNCGHGYHIQCIKQWLAQKNACPVCKNTPVAR